MKVYAVTTKKRVVFPLPDVPTASEAGFVDFLKSAYGMVCTRRKVRRSAIRPRQAGHCPQGCVEGYDAEEALRLSWYLQPGRRQSRDPGGAQKKIKAQNRRVAADHQGSWRFRRLATGCLGNADCERSGCLCTLPDAVDHTRLQNKRMKSLKESVFLSSLIYVFSRIFAPQ